MQRMSHRQVIRALRLVLLGQILSITIGRIVPLQGIARVSLHFTSRLNFYGKIVRATRVNFAFQLKDTITMAIIPKMYKCSIGKNKRRANAVNVIHVS